MEPDLRVELESRSNFWKNLKWALLNSILAASRDFLAVSQAAGHHLASSSPRATFITDCDYNLQLQSLHPPPLTYPALL